MTRTTRPATLPAPLPPLRDRGLRPDAFALVPLLLVQYGGPGMQVTHGVAGSRVSQIFGMRREACR
jgi:hypothetical protein